MEDRSFAAHILHAQLGKAPRPEPPPPETTEERGPAAAHRAEAPSGLRVAVVTVSDTRTLETDRGGEAAIEALGAFGHEVVRRRLVPDLPAAIRRVVRDLVAEGEVDAVITTGGTGLGPRDRTPETLERMYHKPLPGFGELFRRYSEEQIGAAAMLSRAGAGLIGGKPVFCLPGSPKAVKLACERLIGPELGHVLRVVRAGLERAKRGETTDRRSARP